MKEIPYFIERKTLNETNTRIPRNLIQTFKNNQLNDFIYDNIIKILSINDDFNYYLISDEIGVELIKTHFDDFTLKAYNKLNLGAAKGDFLRYIAIYVYGGVYLDLDSDIKLSLSSFINPNIDHIIFIDHHKNLVQCCFMSAPKNPIILKIINEMVKRIHYGEKNIFLATGPTLFTDVVFNTLNNSNIYNTTLLLDTNMRYNVFLKNSLFMNGIILDRNDNDYLVNNFPERMENYDDNMLYNNDKYIVTYNTPTPNFYK